MTAERHGFLLLLDQYPPVSGFTLEQKGMLFDACFHFHTGQEVCIPDPVVATAFAFFRQAFERNTKKYERKCQQNRENIKRRYAKDTNVYGDSDSDTNAAYSDADAEADAEERGDTDVSLSTAEADDANGETSPSGFPPCPHQRIIALYHEELPMLARVKIWNGKRQKHLSARWRETLERLRKKGAPHDVAAGLAWWKAYFTCVQSSRFLLGQKSGKDGRVFRADLAWLVAPENYAKVIEGRYLDRTPRST